MRRVRSRLALALAVTAATAAMAGSAVAHPGGPGGPGGPGPAGDRGGPDRGAAVGGCSIDDSLLLTTSTDSRLKAYSDRLATLVSEGEIDQDRADELLERRAVRLTIQKTAKEARLEPVLALVGMTESEYAAAVKANGLRATLTAAGVSVSDWIAARQEGREAARDAVEELCETGDGVGSDTI